MNWVDEYKEHEKYNKLREDTRGLFHKHKPYSHQDATVHLNAILDMLKKRHPEDEAEKMFSLFSDGIIEDDMITDDYYGGLPC